MTVSHHLSAFRSWLSAHDLDGFIIWRDDMFMGEEVRACDERLAKISGFTGSAGYAVIFQKSAFVVSDGRYHLQMAKQLDPDIWQWRDSQPDSISQICAEATDKTTLRMGFDATTTSVARWRKLPQSISGAIIDWQGFDENPVDALWHDRPTHNRQPAWHLSEAVTGQSASEKIAELQGQLAADNHDGIIISAVDCVNWLLNIRGDCLANTPFHLAFGFVPRCGDPILIEGDMANITCQSWQEFCTHLQDGTYSIDAASLPMALYQALARDGVTLAEASCPLYLPKACKNEIEISGFRSAHLIDALALCRFWYWMSQCQTITSYTETELVTRLQQERKKDEHYLCDSFDTIMGSGSNGAIVHYRAIAGQDSLIQNNNLLLIDSGAHYTTGTTDITRTFLIGRADDEMRSAYSAVLAGHAALAMAAFPAGTTGVALDAICRAPLWATGRDYAHGTGHGVGHILSVHEGPAHISKRAGPALQAGMVLSNEPGYYAQGKWGIRLENLITICQAQDGYLHSESLTLVPFERDLIDKDQLGQAACQWVDAYHRMVYEALSAELDDEKILVWLADKCAPL